MAQENPSGITPWLRDLRPLPHSLPAGLSPPKPQRNVRSSSAINVSSMGLQQQTGQHGDNVHALMTLFFAERATRLARRDAWAELLPKGI